MISIYVTGLLILCFGLLNLFGLNQELFWRQLSFFGIGLIVFFIAKRIGRNYFNLNSKFFYWLFIGFLISVFFLAVEIRGAKRWLNLSFFNFQPSEFFKVFYIIFLSQLLSKKKADLDKQISFFVNIFYFFIPAILIFKQPDLGNTIVLGTIFIALILVSDTPKKYLINLIIFLILAFPVGWFFLQPYQKIRLMSFFNPHLDAQGTAYNMIQSIITIGSGKFFGKGLGLGTQTNLRFLPENYTDFSYASLVEQFGFFGGALIIVLFFLLCLFILKRTLIFSRQDTLEGKQKYYYSLGVLTFLTCQVVVNIGMNLGIMPITGITLPLISYGGSSLGSLMLALALFP